LKRCLLTLFGVDALHTLNRNLMLQLLDFDSRIRSFGNGGGEAAFETRVKGIDIVLEPDATGVVVHTVGRIAR
jgi:hypothetical protein